MANVEEEKCYQCKGNEDRSYMPNIDKDFLTVDMLAILHKNYITDFMTALRSNVCCDKVCFKELTVNFYDGKVFTIVSTKNANFTVTEIEQQLQAYKEFAEDEEKKNPKAIIAPILLTTTKVEIKPPPAKKRKGKGKKKNRNNQDDDW